MFPMASSPAPYLHGYSSPEQQRLLNQAEYWRHDLILRGGTRFMPGERLLEVGCGVGAVLGVLGQSFPGLKLHGVDWEPKQLERARQNLAALRLEAELIEADAQALPMADASFDQAWMMWFLEHVADPVQALREARRVLKPGGGITTIEIDYHLLKVEPETPALRALLDAYIKGMDASGRSDAGTRQEGWLKEAGFRQPKVWALEFDAKGGGLAHRVDYLLGFIETAIPSVLGLEGVAPEAVLRQGAEDFRAVKSAPGGRVRFTVHKLWSRA
jgi:ubiquinone/menaquinone biosynthesis C-methylase UbiE